MNQVFVNKLTGLLSSLLNNFSETASKFLPHGKVAVGALGMLRAACPPRTALPSALQFSFIEFTLSSEPAGNSLWHVSSLGRLK